MAQRTSSERHRILGPALVVGAGLLVTGLATGTLAAIGLPELAVDGVTAGGLGVVLVAVLFLIRDFEYGRYREKPLGRMAVDGLVVFVGAGAGTALVAGGVAIAGLELGGQLGPVVLEARTLLSLTAGLSAGVYAFSLRNPACVRSRDGT